MNFRPRQLPSQTPSDTEQKKRRGPTQPDFLATPLFVFRLLGRRTKSSSLFSGVKLIGLHDSRHVRQRLRMQPKTEVHSHSLCELPASLILEHFADGAVSEFGLADISHGRRSKWGRTAGASRSAFISESMPKGERNPQ